MISNKELVCFGNWWMGRANKSDWSQKSSEFLENALKFNKERYYPLLVIVDKDLSAQNVYLSKVVHFDPKIYKVVGITNRTQTHDVDEFYRDEE